MIGSRHGCCFILLNVIWNLIWGFFSSKSFFSLASTLRDNQQWWRHQKNSVPSFDKSPFLSVCLVRWSDAFRWFRFSASSFDFFFVSERFHFSGNSRVAPESFRQHRSAHLRPLRHEEDHPRTFSVRDGTHFRKFDIFCTFLWRPLVGWQFFTLIYIKSGPGPIKKLSS